MLTLFYPEDEHRLFDQTSALPKSCYPHIRYVVAYPSLSLSQNINPRRVNDRGGDGILDHCNRQFSNISSSIYSELSCCCQD